MNEGRHHPLSTGARRATSASRGAERSAAPTNRAPKVRGASQIAPNRPKGAANAPHFRARGPPNRRTRQNSLLTFRKPDFYLRYPKVLASPISLILPNSLLCRLLCRLLCELCLLCKSDFCLLCKRCLLCLKSLVLPRRRQRALALPPLTSLALRRLRRQGPLSALAKPAGLAFAAAAAKVPAACANVGHFSGRRA